MKDFVGIYNWKNPRAFLINDEKFANAHKEVFDNLWKIAK